MVGEAEATKLSCCRVVAPAPCLRSQVGRGSTCRAVLWLRASSTWRVPEVGLLGLARYEVGVDCGAPQVGQVAGLPATGLPQFQQGLLMPNDWLGVAGMPYGIGCAPWGGGA